MIHSPVPVIATSHCYADYLAAALRNITNGLRLAQTLHDREAEREFQAILDAHVDASIDLAFLIQEANEVAELDASGALADYHYETRRDALDAA